jgi:hypothetical protein
LEGFNSGVKGLRKDTEMWKIKLSLNTMKVYKEMEI